MWETLSLAWQVCLEEAWAAYCAGTVPIGACITSPDGQVMARGRNRIFDPRPAPGYLMKTFLAHAEINALYSLDFSAVDPHACTLYTTTEPCLMCLGAFYMSGLRRLAFASREPYAGSTNLLGATPYMARKPIQVIGPPDPLLEAAIQGLAVDFELSRCRGSITEVLLQAWGEVLPEGVKLGHMTFESQSLAYLRAAHAPVSVVFEELGHKLMSLSGT